MKIDVEGFELNVLKGFGDKLNNVTFIQFEYGDGLKDAGFKMIDIIDYLKQHRDFGLRSEAKYFILDQANDDTENDIHAEFADILHGEDDEVKSFDYVTDDDFYEANIMELITVRRS